VSVWFAHARYTCMGTSRAAWMASTLFCRSLICGLPLTTPFWLLNTTNLNLSVAQVLLQHSLARITIKQPPVFGIHRECGAALGGDECVVEVEPQHLVRSRRAIVPPVHAIITRSPFCAGLALLGSRAAVRALI